MTEDDFRRICKRHDPTYPFSDDFEMWEKGKDRMMKLWAIARDELPPGIGLKIYNEVIAEKFEEQDRRNLFFWRTDPSRHKNGGGE